MYVKITNESGPVDRRFFEKLGAGDKRNDTRTIGQFGSGTCYAPLAALRSGREYVVCGFDNDGLFSLRYDYETVGGIDEVYYLYDNSVKKPSSFTLQAGMLGWNEPWQIFREAMSNALDEFYEHGVKFSVSIVPDIQEPEMGFVSVYISADSDMREIVENFDSYYTINRDPIEVYGSNKLFKPLDGKLSAYCKGVLVYKSDERAIFNYDISTLSLDESRKLSSEWSLRNYASRIVLSTAEPTVAFKLISTANDECWEHTQIAKMDFEYLTDIVSPVWASEWRRVYGNKAVPVNASMPPQVFSAIKMRGYKPVAVSSPIVHHALEHSGIKTVFQLLGDSIKYDFVNLTAKQEKVFNEAVEIVSFFEPTLKDIKISVFNPSSSQENVHGVAVPESKQIYINSRTIDTGLQQTVATLIHEADHVIHELRDGEEKFRYEADNRLANILIANFSKSFKLEVKGDSLLVPVAMVAENLSYDIAIIGDSVLLHTGGRTYKLTPLADTSMPVFTHPDAPVVINSEFSISGGGLVVDISMFSVNVSDIVAVEV